MRIHGGPKGHKSGKGLASHGVVSFLTSRGLISQPSLHQIQRYHNVLIDTI